MAPRKMFGNIHDVDVAAAVQERPDGLIFIIALEFNIWELEFPCINFSCDGIDLLAG